MEWYSDILSIHLLYLYLSSVQAYTQTVYVLDLSPSMAKPRLVNEKSWDPVQQKEVDQGRTITDFEWIAEWLSKKLADEVSIGRQGWGSERVAISIHDMLKAIQLDVNHLQGKIHTASDREL